MKTFRIRMADPAFDYVTSMAAGVTLADARAYFVGQRMNFGDTEAHAADRLIQCIGVEEVA